jgi:asparaginyl-tRNA synthetase
LKKEAVGKTFDLLGWVYRERKQKDTIFLVLRDSTEIIQTVVKKTEVDKKIWAAAEKILIESAVRVKGKVRKDERAPTGYEMDVSDLEDIHYAERFPITKEQSPELLLDLRHLWVRSRHLTHIMKIKNTMLQAARDYYKQQGFYEVTPPILTKNACEGGSTLFEVDYFEDIAYLSQSAQMYLEAMIFSLENVFSITPSFRAERSRTTRHLAEYTHVEGEMAWYDLTDLMNHVEGLIKAMLSGVLKENKAELKALGRDTTKLEAAVKKPFIRMKYEDAVKELQKKGVKVEFGADLGTEEERILTQDKEVPMMVTNYPAEIKAFYMKVDPKDPRTVQGLDVLAPEGFGEIVGASVRETDNRILLDKLKKEKVNTKNYEWYFDLRKFGSVPHAGYGLGLERIVRWTCNLEHIRDTIPFPRTMNRIYP